MEIAAAICLVVGAALHLESLLIASSANRGVRLPWWKNPPRNPGRSVAARAFGMGFLIWGALMIPRFLGFFTPPLLMILLMVVPMIVVIALHNRRVAATDQDFASSART